MIRTISAVFAVLVRVAWLYRYATNLMKGRISVALFHATHINDKTALAFSALGILIVSLLGLNANPWSTNSIVGTLLFIFMTITAKQMRVIAVLSCPQVTELVVVFLTNWLLGQFEFAFDFLTRSGVFLQRTVKKDRIIVLDVPPSPEKPKKSQQTGVVSLNAPLRCFEIDD